MGCIYSWLYLEKQKSFTLSLPVLSVIIMVSFIGGTVINWFLFPDLLYLPLLDRIRYSGLTAYGTLISFFLFVTIYILQRKLNFLENMGLIVYVTCITHGIGRIGCFLAGCCYGKEWYHDHELILSFHRIPTQLMEAGFLFALAYFINKNSNNIYKIFMYMAGYPFFRFFVEFLRDDPRGHLLFKEISVSQEISIYIFIISILLLLFYLNNKKFLMDKIPNGNNNTV